MGHPTMIAFVSDSTYPYLLIPVYLMPQLSFLRRALMTLWDSLIVVELIVTQFYKRKNYIFRKQLS